MIIFGTDVFEEVCNSLLVYMSENKKINRHLCFVCDRSGPLFTKCDIKGIGGVETRSVLLAEMMAKYFSKITFAVRDDGVKLINMRGLDIVFYEPATISNAPNLKLARINADIYIVFESNHITADAVRTCNIIGKPVVFWATSINDYNVQYKLDNHKKYLWGIVARESAYCLYLSDYIISQTFDQKNVLIKNHNINSTVIKNPISVNEVTFNVASKRIKNKDTVLWVGRTDPYNKRPDLLLKIAEKLNHVKFLMILNNIDDKYYIRISQSKTSNIEIVNYVSPDNMHEIFEESSVFLSTSSKEFEGFPNVFLQVISHALPIVSLEVDPDGIFSIHGCGICCNGDIAKAISSIEMLINDEKKRKSVIAKAFNYIEQNHSIALIEKQMVEFFSSVPIHVNNVNKWTEYIFDQSNEQNQSKYNKLEANHNSLINTSMIRILNFIRKKISKKIWRLQNLNQH